MSAHNLMYPLRMDDINPPWFSPRESGEEASGFHPVKPLACCFDPEHFMPSHLHIPTGQKFVHYCPSCGMKSVAFGRSVVA